MKNHAKSGSQRTIRPEREPHRVEIITSGGLESMVVAALRPFGRTVWLDQVESGVVTLRYTGELRALLALRLASSVYVVRNFAVPRPKALLGDQHFRAALALCQTALRLHPPGAFQSLFISAAGAETAVLTRLKAELAAHLGLTVGTDDGDLLLRLRRDAAGEGWELLVRLSPRPLSTRPWRLCSFEGALSGPVAYAMTVLTQPSADDVYLNLGCGSGTLLIERLLFRAARRAIGCDTSAPVLDCARTNLEAADLRGRYELTDWDMRALPLPNATVDVITGDLPFGHRIGSHAENLTLYPALLSEAARVARPSARCVLLSHELRLMERLLSEQNAWRIEQMTRVDLSGLYPCIYVLGRR